METENKEVIARVWGRGQGLATKRDLGECFVVKELLYIFIMVLVT